MAQLQSIHLYSGHALAGILANPDGAQFGGSKVAAMASDISKKLIEEKETRVSSGEADLFDQIACRALEGILANPDGLEHGGSWVAAKVRTYCEKALALPELADKSVQGTFLRHYLACALGGLLTQPEVLSQGASKGVALALGQARKALERSRA